MSGSHVAVTPASGAVPSLAQVLSKHWLSSGSLVFLRRENFGEGSEVSEKSDSLPSSGRAQPSCTEC